MDIHEPAHAIWQLLQSGVAADDIFVIAPSVKSTKPQNPVRSCANELTRRRVNLFIPSDDDGSLDGNVLKGKIVFSSFHQSKGLERKYVFLFGLDRSYYRFYARGQNEAVCANTLYVSMTRASYQMHIFIRGDQPLAFLRGKNAQDMLKLEQIATLQIRERHRNALNAPLTIMETMGCKNDSSVTELVKHIPSVVLDACMRRVQVRVLREPDELIEIPNAVKQGTLKEEVSAINGIAVTAMWEFRATGKISWCPTTEIDPSPENILKLSTIYVAMREKLRFRIAQIRDYTWISPEMFNLANQRLVDEIAGENIQTEVQLARNIIIGGNVYTICGAIDACVNNRIIEIKTTSQLLSEHVLQLALYRWQMCGEHAVTDLNHGDMYVFHLFNVRTNELQELTATQHDLDWIVKLLMCKKLHEEKGFSDEEFVHAVSGLNAAQPCEICMRAML